MSHKSNHSISQGKAQPQKAGGMKIERIPCCADCSTITTDKLLKIGGLYYCTPHAAARGYSGFTAKSGGE